MKIFLTLVLFVLLGCPAIAQNKTDVERYELKGKVKTVEAFRTWLTRKDGKDIPQARLRSSILNFDSKGNLTEHVVYDPEGNISSRNVYTFDAQRRNTGYDEYHTRGGTKELITVPRKHVYTFDEKGNIIERQIFDADGSSAGRFTYKYNEQGKVVESADYRYTGKLGGTSTYTFDEKGDQTSETSYAPDGKLNWKNVLAYDAKGRKTEELRYEGESLRFKIVYKYDDKGRILEIETTEPNPKVHSTHEPEPGKIINIYNDQKRTKQISEYAPDSSLMVTTLLTFNDHGDEIKRVVSQTNDFAAKNGVRINGVVPGQNSNPRNSMIQEFAREYVYDSAGNWTRIISLVPPTAEIATASQVYYIEERIITYY